MSLLLALEGGGTRTTGGLYSTGGDLIAEADGPASNPVDVGQAHSVRVLGDVAFQLLQDRPDTLAGIAAAVSGGSQPGFAEYAAIELLGQFPALRAVVTHDLAALVLANLGARAGVLVISGTGSCVVAQDGAGNLVRIGGRGPLISDEGSAYALAARGLRAAVAAAEGVGAKTALTDALFRGARGRDLAEMTAWAGAADKRAVAQLAPLVTDLAKEDAV
ncbi:MAG: BadF/BadG/BcrA/BcrD ATPase family protein, partial [Candidatus Hydrogenedentales bacterium]